MKQIRVLSSTGMHEFKDKDQALKFIERLRDFDEDFSLVEIQGTSRMLIQASNSQVPQIKAFNEVELQNLMNKYKLI